MAKNFLIIFLFFIMYFLWEPTFKVLGFLIKIRLQSSQVQSAKEEVSENNIKISLVVWAAFYMQGLKKLKLPFLIQNKTPFKQPTKLFQPIGRTY